MTGVRFDAGVGVGNDARGCGADIVMCSAGGVGGGGGRMTGVGPCSALVNVTGRGRWYHSGGGRDANDVLDMDVIT